MNPYGAITHLALLLVLLAPSSEQPQIVVAPGGRQPAPQPTPIPPAPVPTSVKLSGAEFEILTLVNYSGPVTWDVIGVDTFAVPVKLLELKPRESVIGIRAGSTVPDRHEAPETPSVAVWATNTGTATVAAWGVKDSRPVKLATFRVDAGQGPRPPPEPGPGPKPPEPPTPAPEGFRVIFVYESSEPMTLAQQRVMFGEKVRTYLDTKSKGWRRWDKDIDATNEKDADLKALWLAAKPKLTAVPCMIVAVGGKADILPFPADEDPALELLKKYGGP